MHGFYFVQWQENIFLQTLLVIAGSTSLTSKTEEKKAQGCLAFPIFFFLPVLCPIEQWIHIFSRLSFSSVLENVHSSFISYLTLLPPLIFPISCFLFVFQELLDSPCKSPDNISCFSAHGDKLLSNLEELILEKKTQLCWNSLISRTISHRVPQKRCLNIGSLKLRAVILLFALPLPLVITPTVTAAKFCPTLIPK